MGWSGLAVSWFEPNPAAHLAFAIGKVAFLIVGVLWACEGVGWLVTTRSGTRGVSNADSSSRPHTPLQSALRSEVAPLAAMGDTNKATWRWGNQTAKVRRPFLRRSRGLR
jgi:hypothetical protein